MGRYEVGRYEEVRRWEIWGGEVGEMWGGEEVGRCGEVRRWGDMGR